MAKYFYIFLGGGLGALSRFLLSNILSKIAGGEFPIGTVIVNIIGSFFIGFLWEIFNFELLTPELRGFIFIGFIGGFTTFSTYMLEVFNLISNFEYRYAFYYFLITNFVSFIFLIGGVFLARFALHIK